MYKFKALSQQRFAVVVTIIYAVLLGVVMFHHELWRDETQTWLIAKASTWPWDIIEHSRYEGHPLLWFFIVWPFAQLFDNPEWIKAPHYLMALGTAYLILRHAPFPRWMLVLLVFSYYFLYEYAAISRNYQSSVLALIAFLSYYGTAIRKPWVALVLLSVMLWSNIFGAIMAIVLAGYYLWDIIRNTSREAPASYKRSVVICAVLFLVSGIVMAISIHPPADNIFARWYVQYNFENFQEICTAYFQALLPIPQDAIIFWNHSAFKGPWVPYAGLGAMLLIGGLFAKYPKYLLWFVFFVTGIFAFQYLKYLGFLRHSGHYWLSVLALVWLLSRQVGWRQVSRPLRVLVGLLLIVQFYASMVAVAKEITYPFSGSKATANFIKQQNWQDRTIIGYQDWLVSPIGAYLNRPLFYTETEKLGTYVAWSKDRVGELIPYLKREQDYLQRNHQQFLVVVHYPFGDNFPWLREVYYSGKSVVWDENFHLYEVLPAP